MPAVESTRKRGDSADRTSVVGGGRDFRHYEWQKFSYRAQTLRHFLNTGRAFAEARSSSRHCPRSAGRPIAKRGWGQLSRGRDRPDLRKVGKLNPCRVKDGPPDWPPWRSLETLSLKQASGLQKLFAASGDSAVWASGKTQRWAPMSHGGPSATRAVSWVCRKLFIWVNNVDMRPLLVVETVSFRVPRAPSPDLAASRRFANVRPLPGLGQWRNPAQHCCPERDQAQDRHRVEPIETHSGLEPAFPALLSLSV